MAENERTPALGNAEINWTHYNYPPFIRIIHFVPGELPHHKKFIVMSLFILHLAVLAICLLNFIANCIEGGLGILYSILFLLAFNPIVLLIFYRGFTGICKGKANLRMYIILQPIAIILELIASIVGFLGCNGFMRVHELYGEGRALAGTFALVVAILFLGVALFSTFIYVRILRERSQLSVDIVAQ